MGLRFSLVLSVMFVPTMFIVYMLFCTSSLRRPCSIRLDPDDLGQVECAADGTVYDECRIDSAQFCFEPSELSGIRNIGFVEQRDVGGGQLAEGFA